MHRRGPILSKKLRKIKGMMKTPEDIAEKLLGAPSPSLDDLFRESVPQLRSLLIVRVTLCMIIEGPFPLPSNDTIVQPPR